MGGNGGRRLAPAAKAAAQGKPAGTLIKWTPQSLAARKRAPREVVAVESNELATQGLSQSNFSPEQCERLLAPFSPEDVDILPTGEVYVAAAKLRERLWLTFGPGNVGEDRSDPMFDDDPAVKSPKVYVRTVLRINGIPVARADGSAAYDPKRNPRADKAVASESAASQALRRCCKAIGMAHQCWDRRWAFQVKVTWGIQVQVKTRKWNKAQRQFEDKVVTWWRHLLAPPFPGEIKCVGGRKAADYVPPDEAALEAAQALESLDGPADVIEGEVIDADAPPPETTQTPALSSDEPIGPVARKRLFQLMHQFNVREEDFRAHLLSRYGVESTKAIKRKDHDAIEQWLECGGEEEVSA